MELLILGRHFDFKNGICSLESVHGKPFTIIYAILLQNSLNVEPFTQGYGNIIRFGLIYLLLPFLPLVDDCQNHINIPVRQKKIIILY